ncbi:uncharacterized protein [Rhodnius prolixus]|uniref:uncharacterized protein n=1 Tax=Rhodnius prolixus TaxID=13249 RepID=UPI003D18A4EE
MSPLLICLICSVLTYTLAYVPERSIDYHIRPSRSHKEESSEGEDMPKPPGQGNHLDFNQILEKLNHQEPTRIDVIYELIRGDNGNHGGCSSQNGHNIMDSVNEYKPPNMRID